MATRITRFVALTTIVMMVAVVVGMVPATAQTDIDPTDQDATVRAAIGELLTATAEARGVVATNTAQAQQANATAAAQATATTVAQTQAAVTPNITETIDAGLRATVAAITQQARSVDAGDALRQISTELVDVPGGTFRMGTTVSELAAAVRECTDVYNASCLLSYGEDSTPSHEVMLDMYRIERLEVSNRQYVTFLNALGPGEHVTGCDGQPCAVVSNEDPTSVIGFDGRQYGVLNPQADRPATNVTWYGAAAYCAALGRRLPTEAEWEFAARGTDGRVYPWGGEFDVSLARTRVDGIPAAEPVTAYFVGASPFGVLNLAGNVAEWTADWYGADYYRESPRENPTGPDDGTERVLRGGSWDAVPFFARTPHRQFLTPNFAAAWVGFRCVAAVDDGPVMATPTATPTPTD